jgi:thiol:disulfide interchange protein DsbA
MNRRSFLMSAAGASLGLSWSRSADAQNSRPVDPPQPTRTGPKVEVLYFFNYESPHCMRFEPRLDAWLTKQKDVSLWRSALSIDPRSGGSRLYYTLEALKLDLHRRVFTAIHTEHRSLATVGACIEWLEKQSVNKNVIDRFRGTYDSFAVTSQIKQADARARDFKVRSLPALAVDGRFITDSGDLDQMLPMTDFLLERARTERAAAKK